MLLYECFYIAVSGPLIQYIRRSRNSALVHNYRQSHNELPQMCRFLEAGQGGGFGPEQLAATVPGSRVYSGCIEMASAHSFWPISLNILEHYVCSSMSPGALYLNNITSYRYLYSGENKHLIHCRVCRFSHLKM